VSELFVFEKVAFLAQLQHASRAKMRAQQGRRAGEAADLLFSVLQAALFALLQHILVGIAGSCSRGGEAVRGLI
jgi:hypothetical protein